MSKTKVICVFEDGTFKETETDEHGFFQFEEIPAGKTVDILPSNNNNLINGLSTFGLKVLQEFMLDKAPQEIYSPYQVIAGNYDCWTSEIVTTSDLIAFQKLILGINTEMQDCESWSFIPSTVQLPDNFGVGNVFEPFDYPTLIKLENVKTDISVNFMGVKMGDILGDANLSNLSNSSVKSRNTQNLLLLEASSPTVPAEAIFEVAFTSSQFQDIISFQAGLWFDTEHLELLEFLPATHFELSTMLAGENATRGQIRLSWLSLAEEGTPIEQEQALFRLKFRAKADIKTTDWERLIRLDNAVLPMEVVNVDRVFQGLQLTFPSDKEVSPTSKDKYFLYNNFPNPAKRTTTISFYLPTSGAATIQLCNRLGQEVKSISNAFDKGYHEVSLNVEEFPPGIYFYSLISKGFRKTKNMVIL